MESDEQEHIVEVLREYRERLECARRDLVRDDLSIEPDKDGVPTHPIVAEILVVEARILDVESALLKDLETGERQRLRTLRGRLSRIQARLSNLIERLREPTRPHVGWLRHHPPRPLLVPTRYFTTDPPQPAPTISIVTPSFGQGHFLERTLYSVVNQNYPALEYAVQDGGSTDETIEVLRRYEGWLSRWVSEPDDGQGDAINRGFACTSGEIMAYLNSDDLLLPGSLAYVARYFAAHPDVDVVYGHRLMIDEHDQQIGSWVLPRHDDRELTLVDFVPQETLFWRRAAWEAAGARIDPSLRFAIDWDLLLRLRDSGAKMVRVPRFLGAFRVHDDQKTSTWLDQCEIECDVLRRRTHGRTMSHDEAVARAAPYLRRQVAHHLWHRFKARLPLPRQPVRTRPMEPWFRASTAAEPQDERAEDRQRLLS